MISFSGWEMPVSYPKGILAEHQAVRNGVGVFDISHMGQFLASGPGAREWLNTLFTNNLNKITTGQSLYGFLLNEQGGIIDDLIIYEYATDQFLLVVNAAKAPQDFAWFESHLPPASQDASRSVSFTDRSSDYAALAIQGPRAAELTAQFFQVDPTELPSKHGAVATRQHQGVDFIIARTGYTGEDGFEWFFKANAAATVWDHLIEVGAEFDLLLCGLGARDTLRLEVCYPLNGSDLSPTRTPLEAGLGFFVDLTGKPNFIGRDPLLQQKEAGVKEKLVAFRFTDKSPPPRAHYPVFYKGEQVGETTSANLSPSLNIGIGLAYLPSDIARIGEKIAIDIRGKHFDAVIEKKPLYKKH